VSPGGRWLAVIYAEGVQSYVSVFAIDTFGDLKPVATSEAIGVSAFSGVAFSE